MIEKEHTNYPSRYKITEQVQVRFDLDKNIIIKPVTVDRILFTESKVFYDLSYEYSSGIRIKFDNVDSVFVEDLNQVEPNQFARLKNVVEAIDKHLVVENLNNIFYENLGN